jgi:hypothetical protein
MLNSGNSNRFGCMIETILVFPSPKYLRLRSSEKLSDPSADFATTILESYLI